ncbi:MAG: hypothetical protein IPP48_09080 [Chitinophagaceae bacterium]|nr:hypothetical protein [Chitinophagaceae bacterium]
MTKSIVFFALLFLALIISSCKSSKKGDAYPSQVRTNFVNGCASKLPPEYKKNCECMLQQIEKKYSISEYMLVEENIKAGKDVSAFLNFTDSVRSICFPKLK